MSNSLADALMATVPDRRKSGATRKDNVGKRAVRRRERKARQDTEERERELADARVRAKIRYDRMKKLAKPLALETPLPKPSVAHKDVDESMDSVQSASWHVTPSDEAASATGDDKRRSRWDMLQITIAVGVRGGWRKAHFRAMGHHALKTEVISEYNKAVVSRDEEVESASPSLNVLSLRTDQPLALENVDLDVTRAMSKNQESAAWN
ncbi:hypothetical protein CYLTODRAFT_442291 [Cylindrobasidium torrendii FP15055 ss-10]|uniref:Uncharacterized protein n=1 Tax=Cylindrobasidium torrendii FP15055 ss-10 TaxID=1314674 RepID=A0A0D7BHM3_9AGAR|nr:hypothetical protein CYLTODRAFT_442291 [Cylindrobasidium torrendii FP15055 ss-10]